MAKKKNPGGGDYLKSKGQVGIVVPVDSDQHQTIKTAAAISGKAMNEFVRDAAVEAARKAIEAFRSGPQKT